MCFEGIPEGHADDVAKIGDKDFVFNGYTFKRFHPAQAGTEVRRTARMVEKDFKDKAQ
eukprot:m.197345 g.197345  ORF g.197345 m.197345 type:complete len:58 (-) comp13681_c0_seq7:5083-5256(-)